MKEAQQKNKRVPQRICLGCGKPFPKAELIRVVRDPEGEIFIDTRGKANGRGAYICRRQECLENAWKKKGFNRAFRTPVSKEVYDALQEAMKGLE